MPQEFNISRRKALAALGTIGVASAGAGVGTTAFFNDTESFDDNSVTAGTLDLSVRANIYEYQAQANDGGETFTRTINGTEEDTGVRQQLSDVKPGDYSYGKFCFKLTDNPGFLWAGGELTANEDNSITEPEDEVDGEDNDSDGTAGGDLADAIQVTLFYADSSYDVGEQGRPSDQTFSDVLTQGSLREVLAELQAGIPLDADGTTDGRQAFTGSESFTDDRCLAFAWELPTSVGNIVQTDTVEFDLSFVAYQERHNDGGQQPFADATFARDYINPDNHDSPIPNGVLRTGVSFGAEQVSLSFFFDESEVTVSRSFLDTDDYPQTNLPVAIDGDADGTHDFQVIWQPSADLPDDPFGYTVNDGGSYTSAESLPPGYTASRNGNTITFGIPRDEVGSTIRILAWGSTGGEGPVAKLNADPSLGPDFYDSSNAVEVSE